MGIHGTHTVRTTRTQRTRTRTAAVAALAALVVLVGSGCFSVGQGFKVDGVKSIDMGKTTREEIRGLFGEPWRTGVENGQRTWTYGHYRYSAFGPAMTRDLVVRFDDKGIVVAYNFNSTYTEDRSLMK